MPRPHPKRPKQKNASSRRVKKPSPKKAQSKAKSKTLARARESVTEDSSFVSHEADDVGSERARRRAPAPSFTVVGIGASAGGLEAVSALLRALGPQSDLAIILVQHLAPTHHSMLSRLLGETTNMPVHEVVNGQRIEKNHVYIIPPNTQMSIANGHLHLQPRPDDHSRHCPVDFFLRSLADYAQNRAVGVILSGTDSDGAEGIREIKAAGGIAIAQEPKSAKFDGMPRSAIATGVVDMVLPPEQIARELRRVAHHPLLDTKAPPESAGRELQPNDNQFRLIFQLLRQASGVDFTHYKQPTIRRRLQRRMVLNKIDDLDQYVEFLHKNPSEVKGLYEDILIHVTRFFRDPDSFATLIRRVFPQILKNRKGDDPIRIWVPGCATGEEAYSVAIAFLEFLGDSASRPPLQVFATDVSENAVSIARAGLYPENIAADVSPDRLRRFFSKVDGKYRVSKLVRDVCIFARQDLTRDPPFSKLDLILCRNVLIYLGAVLQRKLMNVFHYATKPGGFLMLGSSETIGSHADLFTLADKGHRIYSRKQNVRNLNMDFTVSDRASPAHRSASGHDFAAAAEVPSRAMTTMQSEANRAVLSRYAPPGVIVDEDFQITQFRGQTGPFLEAAAGEVNLNILKMAREGLSYDLRRALHEARKTGNTIRREQLRVKGDHGVAQINIEVVPLGSPEKRHLLILFETPAAPLAASARKRTGAVAAVPASSRRGERENRVSSLQRELVISREYLQSIIQDLEAANEELQSANEEVLSSNEELQSTNEELDTAKEELQSTNEELNTVNDELQARNEELSRLNSDLVNLLGSVQIAIVMVSSDMRIRRFTPTAEKVLNLIPTDIGRPIGDLRPNIECPSLEDMIAKVIDTMAVAECEVRDRQGHWFTMRIRPYKNLENKIEGAVIALVGSGAAHGQPSEEGGGSTAADGSSGHGGDGNGDRDDNGNRANAPRPKGSSSFDILK